MEIKKNRLGHDRSYEKVDSNRIRVTGKSKFTRASENDDGVITMFDFEGGPCFNIGGKIRFQHSEWIITEIEPVKLSHDLESVMLHVEWTKK
tara:strand:- start:11803 stop:12078 length:276 start_codon:yes stop_codon:yes gene_type:complete